MSVTLITVLLFTSLLVMLITGLPIAFCMGGIAVVFTIFLLGPQALFIISSQVLGVMHNLVLIAIPLFIFMGMVLQRSGIADDAYDMLYKWIGSMRGGLAIATIGVCTAFAACCGISGAALVAMGVIALPAMLSRNYDKSIAVGSIAAGSSLGILIPPSILFVIYGIFANESIGKLFAGGVFPGLLLAFLFSIYIAIRTHFQPQLGPAIPPEERFSWGARFVSLRGMILPMLLIGTVLGTIFTGVCTPTEAAGIGSLGSLLCAAAHRKLTWKLIKGASYEALRLSCMVCWIIVGGTCFASLYTAAGATELIRGIVTALPVSPYVILIGIQFILLVLGCLLDPGAIIMITTPIFVPLIKMLGFDPVWFGVLFIINMEAGYLTPPFGFNLFYMKSIVPPDVSMGDIYRSVIPFVTIMIIGLVILVIFPEIALWLPNLIFE